MISTAGSISNDSLRKKSRVQRDKVLLKSHHFFDKVREEEKKQQWRRQFFSCDSCTLQTQRSPWN